MTKKVAVINDLSGLGRCSLTPYRHFKFTNRIPQLLLL